MIMEILTGSGGDSVLFARYTGGGGGGGGGGILSLSTKKSGGDSVRGGGILSYTRLIELHSLMLQAKFQNNRSSGSEEKDL